MKIISIVILATAMAAQGQTPCALNDKPIDCARIGASNIVALPVPVQLLVIDYAQIRMTYEQWMRQPKETHDRTKPCGPENHAGACYDPAPQQKEPPILWLRHDFTYPILQVYNSGRLEMRSTSGVKIMDCKGVNGKPIHCRIHKGHTFDEVMQIWAASLQGDK